MLSVARRRTPAHVLLRRAALTLLAVFAACGGTAYAGTDSFCSQSVASGAVCSGPSHSLTAARGTNNDSGAGCGGAVGYGSFFCATPAGCHTYSGSNVLTPGIRHRSSTAKNMSGYSTWGADGPPAYCDPGSVYAITPGGGSALRPTEADLGVPVMDRPATQAPRELAELVPGADLSRGRQIETPAGPAWVLYDASAGQLCLAINDYGTGYGYSCQPIAAARKAGSVYFLQAGPQAKAGDLAIALVGQGADAVTVQSGDGTSRQVAADRGAVVLRMGAWDRDVTLEAG